MILLSYTILVNGSCMQHDQTLLVVFTPWFYLIILLLFGLPPV